MFKIAETRPEFTVASVTNEHKAKQAWKFKVADLPRDKTYLMNVKSAALLHNRYP